MDYITQYLICISVANYFASIIFAIKLWTKNHDIGWFQVFSTYHAFFSIQYFC